MIGGVAFSTLLVTMKMLQKLTKMAADGTGSLRNRMSEKSSVVKSIKMKPCLGRNNTEDHLLC